jgi:predicted metal-dependent peptidase
MTTQTEERKLQKVKISLMRQKTFALWQGVMMVGQTSIVDDIPTACTNGRDEMYGRKFVASLSEKELAFVVMHETMHKAFRHITTWKKLAEIDRHLCNVACDHVINLILKDMDPTGNYMQMPSNPDGTPMGCCDARFKGMHTKQVFDILREEQEEGGNGKGPPREGDGFDDHDWEGGEELTDKEKETLSKEIDRALRQGEMQHRKLNGNTGGNISRELEDLLRPKVDWRDALRDFTSETCSGDDDSTWARPDRRMLGEGVYMPSTFSERLGHGVIGCDTSGSIGAAEHLRNMSETYAILSVLNPDRVDVIYWDHSVAGHETYGSNGIPMDSFVQTTQPKGGGGTSPTVMMDYMDKEGIRPDFIIMFTDGEIGDWGNQWNAPILWVICNAYRGASITAPVGKTVHVDE